MAVALLLVGCREGPPVEAAGPTSCAAGARMIEGRGCVPAGFQDDGCPAGTLAGSDGTCEAAGVPSQMCAQGFLPNADGTCDAVLPPAECPKGLMALPGETVCRDVAPCAAGKWGDIPVEPSTVYVDQSYVGTDSDGSAAKPWTTIEAGIVAATSGAIVAIAPGSYSGDIVIASAPVRLWGVCPKLVEIVKGGSAQYGAVNIHNAVASGTEVHNVAVHGPGDGITLMGVDNVVIDRVWVHDTATRGVGLQDTSTVTSATVTNSLIENTGEFGVLAGGSTVTVEGTTVRNTQQPSGYVGLGHGIDARDDPMTGRRGSVAVRSCVIERAHEDGVYVLGSDGTVEATVVRDTQPLDPTGTFGRGIGVESDDDTAQRANATIRTSVIERNHEWGVAVLDSDATLEGVVVRDTLPGAADQMLGIGVGVGNHKDMSSPRPALTIRSSAIARSHDLGVYIYASEATIQGTIVRQTQPQAADQQFGRGIAAENSDTTGVRAQVSIRGSIVDENVQVGIFASVADIDIAGTVVRGTVPSPDATFLGDGITLYSGPTNVSVASSVIENNARAGISSFGGSVKLSSSALECNAFHLDGEPLEQLSPSFADLGGDACGCRGANVHCQLESSHLDAPTPLPMP